MRSGRVVMWIFAFLMSGVMMGFTALSVHALSVIDFDQVTDGGSVSYDGNGGALLGSNIVFDFLVGQGTPLNAGTQLTCQSCLLNFATGPNLSEPSVGNPLYTWDGGGFFTMTGTVQDNSAVIASGTLLDGQWASPVVGLKSLNATAINMTGFGSDTKNDALVDYFGLSLTDFFFSNTLIGNGAVFGANGGFTAQIVEADLVNTANAVPEPDSLLILGGALAGLGFWTRRKYACRQA